MSDIFPEQAVHAPESPQELCELLKQAARDRSRVLVIGSGQGVRKDLQCRPGDRIITTTRMRGIVEYEPAEGVVTALAGTPFDEIRQTVRAGGHRLTPMLPDEQARTLGGVIAAGKSGPDRLRFGPLRHHVLGVRVADSSGTITKSGGRLVKNVTGYDLHRLHTGARGSLGLIVEASLRLFPLPQVNTHWVMMVSSGSEACDLAHKLQNTRAMPSWVSAARIGGHWSLHVALEGHAGVVDEEVRVLHGLSRGFEACDAGAATALGRLRSLAGSHAVCRPSQALALVCALDTGPDAGDIIAEPLIASCSWTGSWRAPEIHQHSPVQAALEGRLRQALDPDGTFLAG